MSTNEIRTRYARFYAMAARNIPGLTLAKFNSMCWFPAERNRKDDGHNATLTPMDWLAGAYEVTANMEREQRA